MTRSIIPGWHNLTRIDSPQASNQPWLHKRQPRKADDGQRGARVLWMSAEVQGAEQEPGSHEAHVSDVAPECCDDLES